MSDYRFRTQRAITPLASRGLVLREQELRMREDNAYGKQELESYKVVLAAKQEELKIIMALQKEKQVASATMKVGKLNPLSPTWLKDYSAIMAAHPYAHDDKPLTDLFHQQAKVNSASLSAQIHREATDYTSVTRRADDEFKANLDVKKDKRIRSAAETERVHNELVAKAIRDGVNINDFTTFDEDGEPTNTEWAKLAQSAATAQTSVPNPGVIQHHAKVFGDVATAKAELDAQTAAIGAIDPKSKTVGKSGLPLREEANQAWNATKARLDGATSELAVLQDAFPSLGKKQDAPAQQPSVPSVPQPISAPVATPEAPPSPQATPNPSPTPFNIEDLFPK